MSNVHIFRPKTAQDRATRIGDISANIRTLVAMNRDQVGQITDHEGLRRALFFLELTNFLTRQLAGLVDDDKVKTSLLRQTASVEARLDELRRDVRDVELSEGGGAEADRSA